MRVVVASDVGRDREYMRQAVLGLGLQCGPEDCADLAQLPARLQAAPANVVLLSPGMAPSAALVAVHKVESSVKTPIFVVCDDARSVDIPALLRAGAKGYVRKNELRSDLLDAVVQMRAAGEIQIDWGRIIAVTGSMAGIGVTTVATHLAFALSANQAGRVALVQLSDGVPDLALNLDIRPSHPLAELAHGWDRLDATLLKRCMVEHAAGISVLADQPLGGGPIAWEPSAVRQLLAIMRSQFDFVIADLGHTIDPARRDALRFSDAVAVVQRLDVPAVRIGRDFVARLAEAGVSSKKLIAVANRFGQKEQMSAKEARQLLDIEIGEWVPDDPARVNQALNTGKPLIQTARSAAITESFARLAAKWPARKQTTSRPVGAA